MYSQAIKVALALRLDHLNDEQNEAMTSGTGDGQTATYVIVHVCMYMARRLHFVVQERRQLRKVVRGMTSLFHQTERKQDTQLPKTPDLASSRRADEFHVSQVK